jgi:hypothetical protein
LQELKGQADEFSRTSIGVGSANVFQLDSLIKEGGRVERDTEFLPVYGLEDSFADDFFDERLVRVSTVPGGQRGGVYVWTYAMDLALEATAVFLVAHCSVSVACLVWTPTRSRFGFAAWFKSCAQKSGNRSQVISTRQK